MKGKFAYTGACSGSVNKIKPLVNFDPEAMKGKFAYTGHIIITIITTVS